jgi:hypothetical protein
MVETLNRWFLPDGFIDIFCRLTLDRQQDVPRLCDIHCCGFRYSVYSLTAQFILYKQPRNSRYYSMNAWTLEADLPKDPTPSHLEDALLQINGSALVEKVCSIHHTQRPVSTRHTRSCTSTHAFGWRCAVLARSWPRPSSASAPQSLRAAARLSPHPRTRIRACPGAYPQPAASRWGRREA